MSALQIPYPDVPYPKAEIQRLHGLVAFFRELEWDAGYDDHLNPTPDAKYFAHRARAYEQQIKAVKRAWRDSLNAAMEANRAYTQAELARPFIVIKQQRVYDDVWIPVYRQHRHGRRDVMQMGYDMDTEDESYLVTVVQYHGMTESEARQQYAKRASDADTVHFEKANYFMYAFLKGGRPGAIMCDTDADLSSASELSTSTQQLAGAVCATIAQAAG